MASSSSQKPSSSSSSSSCFSIQYEYEVFLSFRGADTRKNFTSHLYAALNQKGIYTFKDDEELERGKEISSELLRAIEESRISIIVFSENYASSKWCLDELVKIVECMEMKKHLVFPIFYDVDPSNVRNQTGDFLKAFVEHEENFKDNKEKVQRWRAALKHVGSLSGWHLQDSHDEANLIQLVVEKISQILNRTIPSVVENLVGIDSRLKEIEKLLEPTVNDIRFIGIWGMGGIGKTTIAGVVYRKLSSQYEGSCFLTNVREDFEKRGITYLQESLLSKVLNGKNFNIRDGYDGHDLIRRRLCRKRVFIVLDDVDNQLEQLDKLAGKLDWFGLGSRIIITTRDEHVLISHGITHIYKVKGLKHDEAIQLLHSKAFDDKTPTNEHLKLSKDVIYYANGLPLALKVLGSFLCNRSVEEWKSALDKLKDCPNKAILQVLRISYDGLDPYEKNIFLDIVCFFNGASRDQVVEILNSCDFRPDIGITVLIEKSLVNRLNYHQLWVHDLLQEMGWEIIREQHFDEPGKWSRLWRSEHVYDVLTKNKGTEAIRGIMVDMPEQQITYLDGKSFSGMTNLRLLKINNVQFSEDLEFLSNELRFLKWQGYPLNSLPSNFHAQKLFELNMRNSSVRYLWKGIKPFEKLKTIQLSHSCNLIITPDFTMIQNLERLHLDGCINLREVHQSVGFLKRLTILNLENCKNLVTFPSNVCGMKSLKTLLFQGCSKLDKLPQNLGEVESLEELNASGTAIREVPSSIVQLKNLKKLSFNGEQPRSWSSIFLSYLLPKRNPVSISSSLPLSDLCHLESLDLSDCNIMEGEIPESIDCLINLEELNLSSNKFVSLTAGISRLNKLKVLLLNKCESLQFLPELPPKIESVGAEDCTSLESALSALKLSTSPHIMFNFGNCFKLVENQEKENDFAFMLFKRQIQEHSNHSYQFHICLPRSETPKWFSHQSYGNSIEIGLSPNWFNNEFMGFVVYAEFALPDHSNEVFEGIRCKMDINTDGAYFGFKIPSFTTVKSDHLWLGYVSPKAFERISATKLRSLSCVHALFGFYGKEGREWNPKDVLPDVLSIEAWNPKLKSCGIRLVHKQDLEYFGELPVAGGSMIEKNHEVCGGRQLHITFTFIPFTSEWSRWNMKFHAVKKWNFGYGYMILDNLKSKGKKAFGNDFVTDSEFVDLHNTDNDMGEGSIGSEDSNEESSREGRTEQNVIVPGSGEDFIELLLMMINNPLRKK